MTDREAAARDWLRRNEFRYNEIMAMRLQAEELRTAINATVKPPKEVNIQSQRRNAQDEKIISLVELEKKIEEKVKYYKALEEKTVETINRLKFQERMILLYRYIYRKDWKYISKRLHYSEPYCYDMHRKALINIYAFINFTEE